ncbi:hypothetical protein UA32_11920 [Photobacterium angustum]|uniref:MarR family transcriptional regulator n=1 Tax=Photobacterium angustum TaxID=661 RepID=A0ABX5GYJ6_PHOAN|nr:hypothetical protein [Photobacterium angustum]KJG37665.1 hypothetical protein UA32_11920 [Photobacterium angustum]PSX01665.1 hypothetical protein C0W27_22005 [Photobacterium angustum]
MQEKTKLMIHSMYKLKINPKDIAHHTNTDLTDVLKVLKLSDRYFTDEKALKRRLNRGSFIITDEGVCKKCPRCNEFYPIDSEFWPKNSKASDQCSFICKACDQERKDSFKKKQQHTKSVNKKLENSLKILNSIFRIDLT